MGFDKLSAPLHGIPILAHTIAAFMDCPEIHEIILVAPPERLSLLQEKTFSKPLTRIDGGTERHLSVAAGLTAVSPEATFIAVHDAARPLTSPTDLLATLTAAKKHRAASLARRVTETLKRTDEQDFTQSPVPRENLWFIETPQIFEAPLLRAAYQQRLVRTQQRTMTTVDGDGDEQTRYYHEQQHQQQRLSSKNHE